MDYMMLKEASEKWKISVRQVNYYCTDGRIPGDGNNLADPERCGKAGGWQDKKRQGG